MNLSAIIPTWCERSRVAPAVRCCRAITDEVIVADAHSPDGTATCAQEAGARIVFAPKGRGTQLNAGARAAKGDVLLFVHADVELPVAVRPAIERALSDERVIGGNFKLRFVPETAAARLFTIANDVRRKTLRIYYGDSCIFVRRSIFENLGGFPELPLFEDHVFVQRLEARGPTHYERETEIRASSRRFADRPLMTLLNWTILQALFSAGVSPHRLARLYADRR